MQLHSLSEHDVAGIVAAGEDSTVDPGGRPIFSAQRADGRSIHVITALDEHDFVIAVICEGTR
jgi:hypothetical protein